MILSYENSAAAIPSSPTCSVAPCLGILNEPNIQHPNPERRCPHRHQPDTSYTLLASAAPPPIHHPKSRAQSKLAPKICQCVGLTPLTIKSSEIVKSSGNPIMDQSVQTALGRVTKIDSPPTGLGSCDGYTVNINFELQ